jgi:aldehyde dehydrogenase (NAD+)
VSTSPLASVQLPEPVLLIGDTRIAQSSGGTAQHVFAATGRPDPPIPMAGEAEIDAAVKAAASAFTVWRALGADRRRDLMLRVADLIEAHADELVALSIRDSAFPLKVAGLGPSRGAGGFRYYAGWADKIGGEVVPTWFGPAFDYSVCEPYGVIGIFGTWNTPVYNVGLTIAPALAAGNTVVLKPSELAPYAYLRFGELCLEAGLPPGTVNVVVGGPAAGEALVRHPGVGKIHFTGGGPTGRRVAELAAQTLKPVDLELGGKSANIVFPDADLEAAVAVSVGAIIGGSGQTCITAGRMLVHRSIVDAATELAVESSRGAVLGDPFDPSTTMGPVITESALQRMLGMIDRAREGGAIVCAGGVRAGGDLAPGYYLEPTVVSDVDPDAELSQVEVYGPVLAITPFDTEEEALGLANGTPFGLSAYVQTNDLGRAHRMATALEAGSVYVNGRGGLPPAVPFGGVKESGYGRLGGNEGLRTFLRTKNVWIGLG